ncbi:MAG: TIGR02453 family protein, partial [Gemmatimonadetes bacterium]
MPFSAATLTFLRSLKRHNNRPWFEAHRAEYEAAVKQPMHALIEEMDVRLARLAPEIVGDAKRSMFRIYRDIRFSADKSPYKTHASCWFYHRDGSRAVGREAAGGGAGFYFQI